MWCGEFPSVCVSRMVSQRAECALIWGANPEKIDEHGRTVVERSAYYAKADVCRLLIERGSDITGKDEVPSLVAVVERRPAVRDDEDVHACVRVLMCGRADALAAR